MVAVELEARRRLSADGHASSSGSSKQQDLPQLILAAFEVKGHTMSCAIDLRCSFIVLCGLLIQS